MDTIWGWPAAATAAPPHLGPCAGGAVRLPAWRVSGPTWDIAAFASTLIIAGGREAQTIRGGPGIPQRTSGISLGAEIRALPSRRDRGATQRRLDPPRATYANTKDVHFWARANSTQGREHAAVR
jgi:hypothetical protein